MNKAFDTIVAAATPPGRGGVSIVRISGPLVKTIIFALLKKKLTPRVATYAKFLDQANNILDEGIALFFPAPHSFTGEDILELQGHGGPIVVDSIIRQVLKLGARLARPGEFSERAFLNDKIDLAQAEAIADLIDAASEQAARNALRSLQGEFSKQIQPLVEKLTRLRMYVEASIDFVEEEIDFLSNKQVAIDLSEVLAQIEKIQMLATQGSLLRDGITVVIAGEPNVGKSSLLNQLSGKESAIVTDIPGTTRDLLREYIFIAGMPMHIIDTAGLRESEDKVEQEGIRRARLEMAQADLLLWVVEKEIIEPNFLQDLLKQIPTHAAVIVVRNKIDLTDMPATINQQEKYTLISLSAKTGEGVELLQEQIKNCVGLQTNLEGTFSARRRHLVALAQAKDFLLRGQEQLLTHRAGELLAEDLRQAQQALCEITGEFSSDDLLGRIFASFCIGK